MSRLEELLASCDLRQCLLAHVDSPGDLRRLGMASRSTSAACLAYLSGNQQAGRHLLDTAVCSCVNTFQRYTAGMHCVERRLEHFVDSVKWLQGICDRGVVLQAQHLAALRPVLSWYSMCGDRWPNSYLEVAFLFWCDKKSRPQWTVSLLQMCKWLEMLQEDRHDINANISYEVLQGLAGSAAFREGFRRDLRSQQEQQRRRQQRQQHQQLQSRSRWEGSRRCPRRLVYHKR